jgi:hypothetical protein
MVAVPLLVVFCLVATPAAARQAPQKPANGATAEAGTPPPEQAGEIPIDLERIRKLLAQQPPLELLPKDRPIFRISVYEDAFRMPDFQAYLKTLKIPPMAGGPWHHQFLSMVTPKEIAASYTSGENLQMALTGLAWALAMRGGVSAIGHIRNAFYDAEVARIRAEIQRELDALKAVNDAAKKAQQPKKE